MPELPPQPAEAVTADDLFQAIGDGDTGRVRSLLAVGVSPDSLDTENAYSALELAAALGELEVIGALLAGGASPDRGWVQTPLEAAAHEGHAEVVRCLLAAGADVNLGGEEAITPLMSAASGNHVEVVALLLEHGAEPGLRSDVGDTALHSAAVNGAELTYDLLFALTPAEEQGRAAQLLKRARDEHTRRIRRSELATERARSQELIDGELSARGALEVKVENGIYEIEFDWGTEAGEIHTAADHGYVSILRAMLAAGTPVDEREYLSGHTPLMRAAAAGQTQAALLLIEHGAAVNATDSFQSTPLLHTVALPSSSEGRRQRLEILLELIRRGADVDARTRDGETALLLATRWGDVEAVGALVVAGCDVTARNSSGEGAADLAGDNDALVELLSGLGQSPQASSS